MTKRQSFLKAIYFFAMLKGKLFPSAKSILKNKKNIEAPVPFYTLSAVANDGEKINFNTLQGKKILLVNTASDCGFTAQYAELQTLYLQHKNKLVIMGFPSNDFMQQEKGSDAEIAAFCQLNYGVTFPIIQKSIVVKNVLQHPVFAWLSHSEKNGWLNQQPTWNFSKYLVNEKGMLTHYFDKEVSPLNKKIIDALQ